MNTGPFDGQITFLQAQNLDETRAFYTQMLELPLLGDQEACLIFGAAKTLPLASTGISNRYNMAGG
jgi:hypothetical protein